MNEIYQANWNKQIHCKVHVDKENRVIHVLDTDTGHYSVTNGIDEIQEDIMKRHGLSGNTSDWNWVLYGTDGVASLFDQGKFLFAPGRLLYMPFLHEAKEIAKQF